MPFGPRGVAAARGGEAAAGGARCDERKQAGCERGGGLWPFRRPFHRRVPAPHCRSTAVHRLSSSCLSDASCCSLSVLSFSAQFQLSVFGAASLSTRVEQAIRHQAIRH